MMFKIFKFLFGAFCGISVLAIAIGIICFAQLYPVAFAAVLFAIFGGVIAIWG